MMHDGLIRGASARSATWKRGGFFFFEKCEHDNGFWLVSDEIEASGLMGVHKGWKCSSSERRTNLARFREVIHLIWEPCHDRD